MAVGTCQVLLPLSISGVRLCKTVDDGEVLAVRCKGASEIALMDQHLAEIALGGRQIPLPFRVVGLSLGESFIDGEGIVVRRQCSGEVALRGVHLADLSVV